MSVEKQTRISRRAFSLTVAVLGLAAGPAVAGGISLYEVGTADVGLASAGYGARAQDASTVLTNPAGLTRLPGNQFLGGAQVLYGNVSFSRTGDTSPELGTDDGGHPIGSGGWFPGGGGFLSYTVSPTVKVGLGITGNFGLALNYNDDWVGRYYVRQGSIIGLSFLPTIAWKATDKLSVGASVNAMYGYLKNVVAINNIDPRFGDGQLKMKDETWGWGGNVGLLYEFTPTTRVGLTWNSQVNLDFSAPPEFTNLAPGITAALNRAGLLNSTIKIGIKDPQGVMGSLFTQVDDRWALLASVGWQQWSRFGDAQIGIEDTTNPHSITTAIPFKDTWHVSGGAQYRMDGPYLLNFGVAYDSAFQENSDHISPMLPANSQWRFGVGVQQDLGKGQYWGFAAEYAYGGTLRTNIQGRPVLLGGRGNLVGSYDQTAILFLSAYYNWAF
jgi:long-chain fatty acid transport protein